MESVSTEDTYIPRPCSIPPRMEIPSSLPLSIITVTYKRNKLYNNVRL